jgi:heterotetrameric sarcosine oxidase delta subunit
VSFLLPCPLCGPRDVYEFRFGGEVQQRPAPGSDQRTWGQYLYARMNVSGVERAWWFHRLGCRRWFQAERDTRSNVVLRSGWPPLTGSLATAGPGGAAATTNAPAPAGDADAGGGGDG